jgi:hypothetical protein
MLYTEVLLLLKATGNLTYGVVLKTRLNYKTNQSGNALQYTMQNNALTLCFIAPRCPEHISIYN